MALLAHTHLQLRRNHPEEPNVDKLLDDAIALLEQRGMQEMGVRATRYELQQELAPDVLRILETFQQVNGLLLMTGETETEVDYTRNAQARTIIEKEYHDTLVNSNMGNDSSDDFYRRKLGALSTLLSFHKWSNVATTMHC